jgi:hypothetical protein
MPRSVPEGDQDSPASCPDTRPDGTPDAVTDDQCGHSNRGEVTATDTPDARGGGTSFQIGRRLRIMTGAEGGHGSSPATDPRRGADG